MLYLTGMCIIGIEAESYSYNRLNGWTASMAIWHMNRNPL